eukprot:GDKI01034730.1.p1 GENE.GDKI01034730.1~~GDKI01034730.1.p1  ORF type:complete len:156 (-),score=45.41 GDKI01034730.1:333-800(-)
MGLNTNTHTFDTQTLKDKLVLTIPARTPLQIYPLLSGKEGGEDGSADSEQEQKTDTNSAHSSGDADPPPLDSTRVYFACALLERQLREGCGNSACENRYCRSNPHVSVAAVVHQMTEEEIAAGVNMVQMVCLAIEGREDRERKLATVLCESHRSE